MLRFMGSQRVRHDCEHGLEGPAVELLLYLVSVEVSGRTTHLPPRPGPEGQHRRASSSRLHLCQHQELPSAVANLFPHPPLEAAWNMER